MFNLLEQPAEILDSENASELIIAGGHVSLENITFGYNLTRPIIQNV